MDTPSFPVAVPNPVGTHALRVIHMHECAIDAPDKGLGKLFRATVRGYAERDHTDVVVFVQHLYIQQATSKTWTVWHSNRMQLTRVLHTPADAHPKATGRRYAYPTLHQALFSVTLRAQRRLEILQSDLKTQQVIVDLMDTWPYTEETVP